MPRIFVSYRRADTQHEAGRIADFLSNKLQPNDVFFDVDSLYGGDDFADKIEKAVASCDVLLAVIGKAWVSVTAADGTRRLDNEKDFVRLEVGSALKRNIRVIPVLIDGATLPSLSELPPDLTALRRRNAVDIRTSHFNQDAEALLNSVAQSWQMKLHLLLRKPLVWLAAGAALSAVAFFLWPHQNASAITPMDFHLRAQVHLNPQFGSVDKPPKMALAHRLPKEKDTSLLENGKQLKPQTYEYESEIIMPDMKQRYLGLMSRDVDTSFEGVSEPTQICFERKVERNKADAIVRMSCEEGATCKVAQDDFGWAKSCQTSGAFLALPVVYADGPVASMKGWIAPSLQRLRSNYASKKDTAYTEFSIRSGPLVNLKAADRVGLAVQVNGEQIYFSGLPPETNTSAFSAASGLNLQFGLENLNFSGGGEAGREDIEVTLTFLGDGRQIQQAKTVLKYVALRNTDETSVVTPNLSFQWKAQYFPSRSDDVFQIFTSSTRSLKVAQETKHQQDNAKLELAGFPLVALLRLPLSTNPHYGIGVGLRQPSGQLKFTFDQATSRNLCREIVKLARQSDVIDKGAFRRNVAAGTKEACASL